MPPVYFPAPSPIFLLLVAIALTGFMTVAAWIDWKTWRIPKKLTVSMFATGIVAQLLGGGWTGAVERHGWLFNDGLGVGILDGLLFSLAGAMSGFAIFFGLWILGVAGGGDVKHATALGAWLGPKCLLGVLICTVPVVAVILVFTMISGIVNKGKIGHSPPAVKGNGKPGKLGHSQPSTGKPGKNRLLSFSLPLALATLLFFLLMFRVPLGLSTR